MPAHVTSETLLFNVDEEVLGRQLFDCVADLYPICRSITGDGVRETLARLGRIVPVQIHEVPSGTAVFDWTIPDEWNVHDACVKDARGERVIDFRSCNLHLVNYSVPFRGRMLLEELRSHLFALPDRPEWIPYRTSYYQKNWGFCLSQQQLDALPPGEYEVCIDASLKPGYLTYGELYLPGDSPEEVLISAHLCHPSLANDNLSGLTVAAYLARHLQSRPLNLSYRFLFIPATIGAIAWLARNESVLPKIRHGLVLASLGDPGPLTYKRSRRGDATIDRAAAHVLQQLGVHELFEFSPDGYDERQFCSPGFDLPVGRLSRTPYGRYPEYHTSADNLEFVRPAQLASALTACLKILSMIENNHTYLNQKPKGEPHLSKYNLYQSVVGAGSSPNFHAALRWLLNLSDGAHSLLDIAERSGIDFRDLVAAAKALLECGLLQESA